MSSGVCARCNKAVYHAEMVASSSSVYHSACFRCKECGTTLSSKTVTEHREGGSTGPAEVFCNSCYRKKFGPTGYGLGLNPTEGVGATGASGSVKSSAATDQPTSTSQLPTTSVQAASGGTSMSAPGGSAPSSISSAASADNICQTCGKVVYFAEQVVAKGQKFHKLCFKCYSCKKMLEAGSFNEHEKNIYCRGCYTKNFGPKGYGNNIVQHTQP